MHHIMRDMRLADMAIRYSQFVPQLYNYCLSLGFDRSRIMPSRAFCSDESQGYPIMLLARHFGAFPFDHGRVGGRVATDRHGPHAHHGEDLLILQASHVGYDAEGRRFGVYRRQRTAERDFGPCCGKLAGVLSWYQREYAHARQDIQLGRLDGAFAAFVDNALLDPARGEGLVPRLDRLIDPEQSDPLRVFSTSKAFAAAPSLVTRIGESTWPDSPTAIGDWLSADMFTFRHAPAAGEEGPDLVDEALAPAMPSLVTSPHPMLDAARRHTQVEFDRTYRTLQRESAHLNKNVLFVAGLNIDVSPPQGLAFPLTKFVPWAAYARLRDGRAFVLEQAELFAALTAQPARNADEVAFDPAIKAMAEIETVTLPDV